MGELLAAILGAVVGAIAGGWSSFLAQHKSANRHSQTLVTLEIYKSWQSADMLKMRNETFSLVGELGISSSGMSFMEVHAKLKQQNRKDDWISFSQLVHFFELLARLLDEGRLDHPVFWRLFGDIFDYWCVNLFDGLVRASRERDLPGELIWADGIDLLKSAPRR